MCGRHFCPKSIAEQQYQNSQSDFHLLRWHSCVLMLATWTQSHHFIHITSKQCPVTWGLLFSQCSFCKYFSFQIFIRLILGEGTTHHIYFLSSNRNLTHLLKTTLLWILKRTISVWVLLFVFMKTPSHFIAYMKFAR
jgi:hypothetical protein